MKVIAFLLNISYLFLSCDGVISQNSFRLYLIHERGLFNRSYEIVRRFRGNVTNMPRKFVDVTIKISSFISYFIDCVQ